MYPTKEQVKIFDEAACEYIANGTSTDELISWIKLRMPGIPRRVIKSQYGKALTRIRRNKKLWRKLVGV